MPGKSLAVDANILVRAVLGKRVREVIVKYAEEASFFVPDVAFAEAEGTPASSCDQTCWRSRKSS